MMMSNDIGIDLGTASILVYIKGKGVVLKEPSVVALDRETNKVITFGEEARLMIGRTPGNIVAVRPLRKGVISDYTVTEKMLKYFINKAVGKRTLRKPRIAVCIPSGATEVERKAVEDATYQAGAREVCIIEEPVAAAIGAGIDISISANKVKGIRCALCSEPLSAKMTRLHNDANMLAMGAGIVGENLALEIVETFLSTPFSGEERHSRRISLIEEI